MQEKLAARGHKMVTIIDPHIKRDNNYRIHSDASSKGLYTQNAQGAEYDGWCWPGSSSYLDFTSSKVRDWWAEQFAYTNYIGSTPSLYTWNDMNEPSVFNGPEVSMNKDAKNLQGVEHREWHNMYGFYQQMATQSGLIQRNAGQNIRPFVLSRAFYAGSQRFGAIWTGDNEAKWEHLAIASKMLLTIGAAGLTFSGADVGGFFNNPSTELMTRWYQAGAFQPFFRAHAHIDTARREPWLFGDEVLTNLRDIVRTRYHFLPFWYTLFAEAASTGVPTMRPLWMEYPKDANVYAIDDQWLVGSDLLVKPVTTAAATSVEVYFPGTEAWYDIVSFEKVTGPGRKTVAAPLTKIPVYQRAGSIIPKQLRARRASSLMAQDPYTLIIVLDSHKSAQGQLYLDDGNTFDYRNSNLFRLRKFDFSAASDSTHELKSSGIRGGKLYAPANTVERIVILGAGRAPVSITASDAGAAPRSVDFTYDASLDAITLRKPDVKIAYDWTVQLQYKRA
jgi:alpha 1,3-glucosidase